MADENRYAGLPDQVRKMGEQADALEKQMRENGKTGEDILPDQAPENHPQDQPDAKPQPKPTPQDQPAPQNEPGENWEQKFYTLQGKYNSEVPRLHAENRELNNQINSLHQKVENLEGQIQNQQQNAPDGQTASSFDFDPEALEDFGPEFVEVANIVKKQASVIEDLKEQLKNTAAQVQGVQEKQTQQVAMSFEDKLTKACPEWARLNNDRDFNDWLHGNGFFEALNINAQKGDVEKTASFFNRYLKESGTSPESPANTPKTPPAESPVNPQPHQPNLEEHLAPQVNGGGGEVPVAEPSFTRDEVQFFYQDLAQASSNNRFPFEACGRLIKSKDDAVQLEYDIARANEEGRIR